MSEEVEQIEVKGSVFDREERTRTRIGGSNHVTIPAKWKRFFQIPLLELELILDDKGGWCILVTKPRGGKAT